MSTVSVIVDSAAPDEALKACLESLQAQTFSDFEIIKSARNEGLKRAVGEYVYFMPGDGMLFENGLELLVNAAEKSGAEIIHSTSFVERNGENVEVVASDMYSFACLNLYRRDFLERHQLKFPASGEDEAFCYAAVCLADQIFCIDEYFYVGMRRQESRIDDRTYVADINRDEIRDGFLVTSQRKKLWNAQIKLIHEFARICRKHDLKWFAHTGTLLGAVRHRGFIPWDDDVDLAMMRPDFEKFKQVAPNELKPQFFLDLPQNYALEGESNEENLPLVSTELADQIRAKGWRWPVVADYFKIRDNSTSMIQWKERRNFHQGIWIDIFPFDPVPPFDDPRKDIEFAIKKELMMAVSFPDVIREALANHEQMILSDDVLNNMLKQPFQQRSRMYLDYLNKKFFDSKCVGRLTNYFLLTTYKTWDAAFMKDLIELPFELTTLPAPRDYDPYLKVIFGDWRDMIFKKSHVSSATVDMSYKEFFEQVSPAIKEFNF